MAGFYCARGPTKVPCGTGNKVEGVFLVIQIRIFVFACRNLNIVCSILIERKKNHIHLIHRFFIFKN